MEPDAARTSVDNGTLECTFEHHHRKNHGWTVTMVDGRPVWTAADLASTPSDDRAPTTSPADRFRS